MSLIPDLHKLADVDLVEAIKLGEMNIDSLHEVFRPDLRARIWELRGELKKRASDKEGRIFAILCPETGRFWLSGTDSALFTLSEAVTMMDSIQEDSHLCRLIPCDVLGGSIEEEVRSSGNWPLKL